MAVTITYGKIGRMEIINVKGTTETEYNIPSRQVTIGTGSGKSGLIKSVQVQDITANARAFTINKNALNSGFYKIASLTAGDEVHILGFL